MNHEALKYSRIEYERRFLVSAASDWKTLVEPYSKTFEDKYIQDSRLRLRILSDSDSNRKLIKLTKKYESDSPYFQQVGSIILSPDEYPTFDALKGHRLTKIRHYHNFQGQIFSIDVFAGELEGLLLCETEMDSLENLMRVEFPAYAAREVTEDLFFTGGNLSRTTRAALLEKLSDFQ
jgi:CYTH domain-containing protein